MKCGWGAFLVEERFMSQVWMNNPAFRKFNISRFIQILTSVGLGQKWADYRATDRTSADTEMERFGVWIAVLRLTEKVLDFVVRVRNHILALRIPWSEEDARHALSLLKWAVSVTTTVAEDVEPGAQAEAEGNGELIPLLDKVQRKGEQVRVEATSLLRLLVEKEKEVEGMWN
ncbi:hypothetical protein QCA50_012601 [Cerrena zonata]|uniref:Uncharacterized protein n=1 Tax=Cerrena zonata TaxID=2478898 RepID=A0AAW0FVU3_9APHY